MKKISVICIILQSFIGLAQELGAEARLFLDKVKSQQPDSIRSKIKWDDPKFHIRFGSQTMYYGNNKIGNELMQYGIQKLDSVNYEDYHEISVQNTKNGNYIAAIEALEKSSALSPEINGYYGWVLLYYYHDYEKALEKLNAYDTRTPQFNDAAVGEDILFLKGLAHMKLGHYETAIQEFDINIKNITENYGEQWTNAYCSFYKGRCYEALKLFEKADKAYDTTIRIDTNCTEAYYYKGLNLKRLKQIPAAKTALLKSLELIHKGFKQTDVYVELFDEIYLTDIQEAINKF
jgi:tetratricopeptide (TPR) repeat protein